jgi:hypothetical protein
MPKKLRYIVLILLAPLVYALAREAVAFVTSNVTWQAINWFLIGLGAGAAAYILAEALHSKSVRFIEVFRHELAHFVVSILLGKMPESIFVSNKEAGTLGEVKDVRPWFWVGLAPYYFPVFTIPLLLIKPVVPGVVKDIADLAIGVTLVFQYGAIFRGKFFRQPDVKKTGRMFSFIVTLVLNIVWLVIILCVVTENYAGIITYFKGTVGRTVALYKAIFLFSREEVLPVLGRVWEVVKQAFVAVLDLIF